MRYSQDGGDDATEESWKNLLDLTTISRKVRSGTKLLPYSLSVLRIQQDYSSWLFYASLKKEYKEAITTVCFDGLTVWHDVDIVPDELAALIGLKTIIRRIDKLTSYELREITKFATSRKLKLIDEENSPSSGVHLES